MFVMCSGVGDLHGCGVTGSNSKCVCVWGEVVVVERHISSKCPTDLRMSF